MAGMPWVFEQGLMLSVVEDYLSNPERALATLRRLRPPPHGTGEPVARAGGLDHLSAAVAKYNPVEHLERHWFGRDPQGRPVPTWWLGWSGDAEEIMRWTLITAIERSLGLRHVPPGSAAVPELTTHHRAWPIHLYWSCGAPMFQGWVSWHRHGAGARDGVVNAVFTTPGTGEHLYATPHPDAFGMVGAEDPAVTTGDHGLWVIAQDATANVIGAGAPRSFPRGEGVLPLDYGGLTLESSGDIVIVAPSERTGGVLPGGRPFQPTPP